MKIHQIEKSSYQVKTGKTKHLTVKSQIFVLYLTHLNLKKQKTQTRPVRERQTGWE